MVKKTADEWLNNPKYDGIVIVNPKGWDNFEESWEEAITEEEFKKRLSNSTLMMRKQWK